MSYRIVLQPDGSLGVFDDGTSTWAGSALGDEAAGTLLGEAESIDPGEAAKVIRGVRVGWVREAHSKYTMTWEEAEWHAARSAGRPVGSQPLERNRRGERIRKHGLSGYARGCRCDVCERREDDGSFTHGFGPTGKPSGYSQGCRCRTCKDAKAEYERELRARKAGTSTPGPAPGLSKDEVRDTSIGIRVAPAEKAAIERLAAQDGIPAGQFLRDPALKIARERTGYEDTVPWRPWQVRREGVSGTGEDEGDGSVARAIVVGVRLTKPEKALIEQLAAQDGMPAGQWLRDPVLDIVEERGGYEDTARRKAPRRPNRSSTA